MSPISPIGYGAQSTLSLQNSQNLRNLRILNSGMNFRSIRPHYLLKIDTASISCGSNSFDVSIPASVRRELEETNFVVVRRGVVTENWVPIGIRGHQRSQRWAAWYPRYAIQGIIKPMDLLTQVDTMNDQDAFPAHRALRSLIKT